MLDDGNLNARADAHGRFMTYARLYVLCKNTRQEGEAEAYLVDTRYWLLRERELSGYPETNAGTFVSSWDSDKVLSFIMKWDRDMTDGKGPAYLLNENHSTQPSSTSS